MRRPILTAVAVVLLGAVAPASADTFQVFRYRAVEVHGEWGRAPTQTPPPGFAGEVFTHATVDAGHLRQLEYGERTTGPFTYYNAETYTYDDSGSLVYLTRTTSVGDEADLLHVRIEPTLDLAELQATVHVTVCVRQPDASYECNDGEATVDGSWTADGVDDVQTELHRVVFDPAANTTTTIDSTSFTRSAGSTTTVDGVALGTPVKASLDRQFLNTVIVCHDVCPEHQGGAAAGP
jgi:hypothetical protein